jgi:hypothetical protein
MQKGVKKCVCEVAPSIAECGGPLFRMEKTIGRGSAQPNIVSLSLSLSQVMNHPKVGGWINAAIFGGGSQAIDSIGLEEPTDHRRAR